MSVENLGVSKSDCFGQQLGCSGHSLLYTRGKLLYNSRHCIGLTSCIPGSNVLVYGIIKPDRLLVLLQAHDKTFSELDSGV